MQGGHLAQPDLCTQGKDAGQGGHDGQQEDQQPSVSQVSLSSCNMASIVASPGHGLPHGDADGVGDCMDEEIQEENNSTKRNADCNNKN